MDLWQLTASEEGARIGFVIVLNFIGYNAQQFIL